jgi:hypothetical protein
MPQLNFRTMSISGQWPEHIRDMVSDIHEAVGIELRAANRGVKFQVLGIGEGQGILTLHLDSDNGVLEPTMEDGTVQWEGESPGIAQIVSVDANTSRVHAHLEGEEFPKSVRQVWIRPPKFLEALREQWGSNSAIRAALSFYTHLTKSGFDNGLVLGPSSFSELRKQQREAFKLPGHDISFLWGPPGTGKTHCLGRMIAAQLVQRSERILLVSSTNVAVDQAVLSVRNGLVDLIEDSDRHGVYRFGSRFLPDSYIGDAERLIPVISKTLVADYRRTLGLRPSPKEPLKFKLWKESVESLRAEIRDENLAFLRSARVAAVTATYAVIKYEDLVGSGAFDLVVFDDASQIGKAHAMMIAGLGGRVVFVGDPKQLSPIVQSKDDRAARWMGHSPFDWRDLSAAVGKVNLNEQSRMAKDICRVVSDAFYDGSLRVAEHVSPEWHRERTLSLHSALGSENVTFFRIGAEARASGRQRRWVCPQSADAVVRIVHLLKASIDLKNVMVLTPYRAQRSEICRQLKAASLDDKIVRTVHTAQGLERPIIIFDPVRPSSGFLNGPEGERLINVAMSRAQARLLVMVHPDYKRYQTVISRVVGRRSLVDANDIPDLLTTPAQPGRVADTPIQLRTSPAPEVATLLELKRIRKGLDLEMLKLSRNSQSVRSSR